MSATRADAAGRARIPLDGISRARGLAALVDVLARWTGEHAWAFVRDKEARAELSVDHSGLVAELDSLIGQSTNEQTVRITPAGSSGRPVRVRVAAASLELETPLDSPDSETARLLAAQVSEQLSGDSDPGVAAFLGAARSATADAAACDHRIDTIVRRVAEDAPEATAAVDASTGERVSYSALIERADRVSAALRDRGVRPGHVVGVSGRRGIPMLVTMLGAAGAGAVFMPIDADLPAPRVRVMLEDARSASPDRAPLVIALPHGGHSEHLASLGAERVALVELESSAGAPAPSSTGDGERPAYVMYTSGSTGTPKGVVVPHRAIVRLVRLGAFTTLDRTRVWAQLAPVGFDASTLEIWAALLTGGRLVIDPAPAPTPARLRELTDRFGVTSAWLTASLFNLIAESDPSALAGLDELLIGGEALSPEHVDLAQRAAPGLTIINGYGPTENTTFTCCYELPPPESGGVRSLRTIPIGAPIGGTAVCIIGEDGRPAPRGARGEVVAFGLGVAAGYLNRPDETARRFAAFEWAPGLACYRTGDLGRALADGTIEFLGRIDDQVKIRGKRVEPGEIETTLRTAGFLEHAAVIATGSPVQLVAFYTTTHGGGVEPGRVRGWLADRLPPEFIPERFIQLDALPIGATGKVDRAALAGLAGDQQRSSAKPPHAVASVAEVMGGVLGRPPLAPDESLFAAGGDSLDAIRLVARLEATRQRRLDVAAVFAAPTPAAIEAMLESAPELAPPEAANASPDQRPMTSAERRLWYEQQRLGDEPTYNEPFAMRLAGPVDLERLESALRETISRFSALRTTYHAVDGDPVARTDPAPAFTIDRRTLEPGVSIEHELVAEARRPFDLQAAPLLRATVWSASPDERVLLLVFHHLVLDDWSLELVLRHVSSSYNGVDGGSAAPETTGVFGLEHARDTEAASRWATRIAESVRGRPRLPRLSEDSAAPTGTTERNSGRVRFRWDLGRARAIERLAARIDGTPFMVGLAALATALARISGQERLVVGTPIALRDHPALMDRVGLWVNTLPVPVDAHAESSFDAILEAAKHRCAEAQERCWTGLDAISAALHDRAEAPVRVVYVHRRSPVETLDLDGVRVTPVGVHNGASKFDLTVFLSTYDDRVEGEFEFRPSAVSRADVERLVLALGRVIDLAAERPNGPISARRLLGRAPRALQSPQQPAKPNATRGIAGRPPGTTTERAVADCWRELLDVAPVAESDFFDLGGHSLLAVKALLRLERRFGITLPVGLITRASTVEGLARAIDERLSGTADESPNEHDPIVVLRAGDRHGAIVCIPGVGGEAVMFRPLAGLAPEGRAVLGVQISELDRSDDKPDVGRLAQSALEGLRRRGYEPPYVFLGYSFGGLIAYDIATRLSEHADAVELLALCDTFEPVSFRPKPWHQRLITHAALAREHPVSYLGARLKQGAMRLARRIGLAPEPTVAGRIEQEERLVSGPRAFGVTGTLKRAEVRGLQAARSYRPPAYAGDLTILRADKTPQWYRFMRLSPELGWERLVTGSIETLPVHADHHQMFTSEGLAAVADGIRSKLESGAALPESTVSGYASDAG